MHRHSHLVVVGALSLVTCTEASTPDNRSYAIDAAPTTLQPALARAQEAIGQLKKELGAKLRKAVSGGDYAQAIEVCKTAAGELTRKVGAANGMKLGRTSSRVRNPQNLAPEWMRKTVYSGGVKAMGVEGRAFDLGEKVGVVLPISTMGLCTSCHGKKDVLADDVREVIAREYPKDAATGFAVGDLRGWFWAEVPVSPAKP